MLVENPDKILWMKSFKNIWGGPTLYQICSGSESKVWTWTVINKEIMEGHRRASQRVAVSRREGGREAQGAEARGIGGAAWGCSRVSRATRKTWVFTVSVTNTWKIHKIAMQVFLKCRNYQMRDLELTQATWRRNPITLTWYREGLDHKASVNSISEEETSYFWVYL